MLETYIGFELLNKKKIVSKEIIVDSSEISIRLMGIYYDNKWDITIYGINEDNTFGERFHQRDCYFPNSSLSYDLYPIENGVHIYLPQNDLYKKYKIYYKMEKMWFEVNNIANTKKEESTIKNILNNEFCSGYKKALEDIKEKGIIFDGNETYGVNTKIILLSEEKYKEIFKR